MVKFKKKCLPSGLVRGYIKVDPPPIPNNLAYCGTYWLRNSIFNKIIFFKCLYVSFDALLIHSYSKNDFLP